MYVQYSPLESSQYSSSSMLIALPSQTHRLFVPSTPHPTPCSSSSLESVSTKLLSSARVQLCTAALVMTQQHPEEAVADTLSPVHTNAVRCTCCVADIDSEHDATVNDSANPEGHSHETRVRLDGKVECWPRCAACCHHFEHRFCGADCAAHISTSTGSAVALCRGTEQTSSVSSLLHCEPAHSCQHDHDGLRHRPVYRLLSKGAVGAVPEGTQSTPPNTTVSPADDNSASVIGGLSLVDRFLSVWIILVMIIGVLVGYYSSSAVDALNSVQIVTVSLPVSFGLWFMMYPVLVKVRYESFGAIFRKRDTYRQLLFSVSANWVSHSQSNLSHITRFAFLLT